MDLALRSLSEIKINLIIILGPQISHCTMNDPDTPECLIITLISEYNKVDYNSINFGA